jgi:Mycobacterium 19 kDa lipoprotein antigen
MIAAGSGTEGMSAIVDRAVGVTAKSVSINNFAGFTGQFWEGVQGNAKAGTVDKVFTISGVAVGYLTGQLGARTPQDFSLQVAC